MISAKDNTISDPDKMNKNQFWQKCLARYFLTPFCEKCLVRRTGEAPAEMTVVLVLGVTVGTQQRAVGFGAADGIHGDEIGHGWKREGRKGEENKGWNMCELVRPCGDFFSSYFVLFAVILSVKWRRTFEKFFWQGHEIGDMKYQGSLGYTSTVGTQQQCAVGVGEADRIHDDKNWSLLEGGRQRKREDATSVNWLGLLNVVLFFGDYS